jgi:hypothetical protein
MEKELNRDFSKKSKEPKTCRMLNILGPKGNANQSHAKIPPHSCKNGYHQEHKQQ